jgi:hypothetical protein
MSDSDPYQDDQGRPIAPTVAVEAQPTPARPRRIARLGFMLALMAALAPADIPLEPPPADKPRRTVREVLDRTYTPMGQIRIHALRKGFWQACSPIDASTVEWHRLHPLDEIEEVP